MGEVAQDLDLTLKAVNHCTTGVVQNSPNVTTARSQASEAGHVNRVNISAERTISNDEFNRNEQNQRTLFTRYRQENLAIAEDRDAATLKNILWSKVIDKIFNLDHGETSAMRTIQDGNRGNEILDKLTQVTGGGMGLKAFQGMQPENNIQHMLTAYNGINQANSVNTSNATAKQAMELALAAVQQRQYEK